MTQSFQDGVQCKSWLEQKVEEWLLRATLVGDCLIAHVKPNVKGYCYMSFGRGSRMRAHRAVYKAKRGDFPEELLVLHTCDNRACINPDHLVLGTAFDNTHDMMKRNRCSRIGTPVDARPDKSLLLEALNLRRAGWTLAAIARHQGLAGATSAAYRIRSAENAGL